MSDVAQGPGWWMANDGKFYPPPGPAGPPPGPPKKGPGLGRAIVVIVAVVVALFVLASLFGSKKPTETTTAASSVGGTTSTTVPWEQTPVTQDSVVARLRAQKLDPANVTVTDGGVVVVQYKRDYFDANTLVQAAGMYGLDTARALFPNPAVTEVTTGMLGDFTDSYGKTTTEVALSSTVGRATADKISWDGLHDRVGVDGSNWFCIADGKVAHPAILRKVETKRGLVPGVPC